MGLSECLSSLIGCPWPQINQTHDLICIPSRSWGHEVQKIHFISGEKITGENVTTFYYDMHQSWTQLLSLNAFSLCLLDRSKPTS